MSFLLRTTHPLTSELGRNVPGMVLYKSGVAIFDICPRSKIMRLTIEPGRVFFIIVNLIIFEPGQISKIATPLLCGLIQGTSLPNGEVNG